MRPRVRFKDAARAAPHAACSSPAEACDDLVGNGLRLDDGRIGGIARRPHASLATLHRKLAAHAELMIDIEARSAKRAHLRGELDRIAETRGRKKARAGVHQRNAEDVERASKIGRLYTERCLEQDPSAPVEEFEEPAVEDDAGGVAMRPFDGELPPADEIGHDGCVLPACIQTCD